jgi:hypothetical protein
VIYNLKIKIMTTITLEQNIQLTKSKFLNIEELMKYLYEEYLEIKMQEAKKENDFIDYY